MLLIMHCVAACSKNRKREVPHLAAGVCDLFLEVINGDLLVAQPALRLRQRRRLRFQAVLHGQCGEAPAVITAKHHQRWSQHPQTGFMNLMSKEESTLSV